MPSTPEITVGLVTWNSAADLPACLAALAAQTGPAFDLVVVDNASADDSLALVIQHFPAARVICNHTNTGFCRAHNQAIRASSSSAYLPLNPDVILQPGYLAAMRAALDSALRVGLVAGKLLLPTPAGLPPLIDSTGLFIDRKRRQYLRGFNQPDQGQYDAPGEVFGVDGAAPLYSRAMLEEIALSGEYFDELFFAHKEDVDLSWRARLLGWRCLYTPAAIAVHRRTFRPGRRAAIAAETRLHAVKNRYLTLIKNESPAGFRRDWPFILGYDLKIIAYLCLFERSSLPAFAHLRRQWPTAWARRREIWSRVRATPAETESWFR